MSELEHVFVNERENKAVRGDAMSGTERLRERVVETLDSVVIRFVGDSGDGMQLTGSEFSRAVAKAGHGFATHPDYPSEIRAPTGTVFGVSGYQIQYGAGQVFTVGGRARRAGRNESGGAEDEHFRRQARWHRHR